MNDKIFRAKTAITSEEVVKEQEKYAGMGISKAVDASDIKYVNVSVPYKSILFSEESLYADGTLVYLIDGTEMLCDRDPFEETDKRRKEDCSNNE